METKAFVGRSFSSDMKLWINHNVGAEAPTYKNHKNNVGM